MRESTAWRILAEEHDARRTGSEFLCVNLDHAAGNFYPNSAIATIPPELRQEMKFKIVSALGDRNAAYDYEYGAKQEQREARVLACLMFEQQARDEEREIREDLRASAELPF